MNIIEAIHDEAVFARHFRDMATWQAWLAFLCALFGLAMTLEQERIYRECTGRTGPIAGAATEAWLVIGRRGGKSFVLALIAVFCATFRDWRGLLGPGERATVMVLAADRRQAKLILGYVRGLLQSVPMLAGTIESDTAESVQLRNSVSIEVHSASFRTVRGYSVVAALADELAFWRSDESANPDTEILAALRPAMATIPGALLLCASSPSARRGALWKAYKRHFGKEGSVLVWQAPTRTMNPSVPQSVIDAAYEDDLASAAAEFGAQFRSDIEAFVSQEVLDQCIVSGCQEIPRQAGIGYVAFVDPSGGSFDAMTLAIGHLEGNRAVLDCVRERRPPFSPDDVVAEFAATLKLYDVHRVKGDRYGGEFTQERFRTHGIHYEAATRTKSELYAELLPLLNSRRVDLLDYPRLTAQLIGLERHTGRGGRDSIDHAPGAHDDLANAVAGFVVEAIGKGAPVEMDPNEEYALGRLAASDQDAALAFDAGGPIMDFGPY